MCLVKTVQVFIRNKKYLRIFNGFNKIPAGVPGYKAPERNYKLVLRKKENILFLFSIRVTVVYPENPFNDQPKVVTNHTLHIKIIPLIHFSRLPKWLAVADVLII